AFSRSRARRASAWAESVKPPGQPRGRGNTLFAERAVVAGCQWFAGDFLPVTNVDLVRSVRTIETADFADIVQHAADLFVRRQLSRMFAAGGTSPQNACPAIGQQRIRAIRRFGIRARFRTLNRRQL